MALALKKTQTRAPWGEYVGIGPLTVEEFNELPLAEEWVFELYEGSLIRMPGPGKIHSIITARLNIAIQAYLLSQQLGILLGTSCYYLSPSADTEVLLCPDLSYVVPKRLATMPERGSYVVGAPDFVIEITSPNDYRPQMEDKAKIYLQAGVRLVWVVWPNRQIIDVWQPTSMDAPTAMLQVADALDGQDVIPGFTCPVSAIFAEA